MTSGVTDLAPQAKRVLIFRNGDPFHGGRRLVVNQRQFLTFEAFLTEVTNSIQASMAVRNLYTPRQGHRVTELVQLKNGNPYVAAGFEKFKGIDYLHTGEKQSSGTQNRDAAQGGMAMNRKLNISARWRKNIQMPCIIHVFRNGDLLSPPFRVLLSKRTLAEWELVLSLVTEKASLRSGAVRKLCTLDGVPISSGEELSHGEYYVAVGAEKYKSLPYMELLVPKHSTHRALLNHPENRRRMQNDGFTKNYSMSQDGVSDSALISPPEQLDPRRVQSTGDAEAEKVLVSPPPARRHLTKNKSSEEESIFYAKPVRVRPNAKTNPIPPLENNQEATKVFKVKQSRREIAGASEVLEDENTRVELPLDQQVAETIKDETTTTRKKDAAPKQRTIETEAEATPRKKAAAPKQRVAEILEEEATPRKNVAHPNQIIEEEVTPRKKAATPNQKMEEIIKEKATPRKKGADHGQRVTETIQEEATPRENAAADNQTPRMVKGQEATESRASQHRQAKDTKGRKVEDKMTPQKPNTKGDGKRRPSHDAEEEGEPDTQEEGDLSASQDAEDNNADDQEESNNEADEDGD
ncbi:doublecortin domain-containing protein 2B isoform X2 [Pleurodeles waltl]|uniref:doublecortin domain-containing protein 2B isoform X2 n=1 Tax=Pleurodeles waltl TaxID=8319 RepID=UPI0037094464